MPKHHETQNTVATTSYCNTCQRMTLHSVSGKRRGLCQEHEAQGLSKKQEQRQRQREEQESNPRLL